MPRYVFHLEFNYTQRVAFSIQGNAVTKSNAHGMTGKSGRMVMFVPKKYKDYEKAVRAEARLAMSNATLQPFTGDCIMLVRYFYDTRRLRDVQNLPKSTCDALNEIVYTDDSQVKRIVDMGKFFDKENPRVEIEVLETNKRWYESTPDEP